MPRIERVIVRGLVLSLLFSLLAFINVAPAKAAFTRGSITSYPVTTTGGGGQANVSCPGSGVLSGVTASNGATDGGSSTYLYGTCATLNSDGTSISSTSTTALGPYGGSGTSPTALDCSTTGGTSVIVGARVYKTPVNGYVAGFSLLCGTLPAGGSRSYTSSSLGLTTSTYEDIACNTGNVAIGFNIYYGGILDKLGFQCAPIQNATQTITFTQPGAAARTWNVTSISVSSSSGLTVTRVSNSTSVCTVSGSTVTLVSTGTCSITASQAGDTNFAAAISVTRTFQVIADRPAITTSNYDGDGPGVGWPIYVTTTGGETVTVTGTNLGLCTEIVAAGGGWTGSLTLSNVTETNFTFVVPAPTTFYGWIRVNCGGTNFDISAAVQRVTPPSNSVLPVISGTLRPNQLLSATNGSWSGATSYTYAWSRSLTSNGTFVTIAGADTNTYLLANSDVNYFIKVTVTARNLGSSVSATSVATAQVTLTSQSITFTSLGTTSKSYPYSQVLSMTTSGTSGSGAISFVIASGGTATSCALSDTSTAATLTAASAGTCLIRATIASDSTYDSATSTALTFTFNRASQSALSITSTTGNYGTTLTLVSTGGTSSSPVTYAYSPGTTTCTLSGNSLSAAAPGTCLITATKALDVNYLAISSSQTTITFDYGVSTASVTINAGDLIFRQSKPLTAVGNVPGRMTFWVNNAVIPGCKNLVISAGNSFTRTCNYRPSTRGFVTIKVTLVPTDSSFNGITTQLARLFVYNRSGVR